MTIIDRRADGLLVLATWGLHVVVWYLPDPAISERAAALAWASLLWLWLLLWTTVAFATDVYTATVTHAYRRGILSRGIVRTTLCTALYGQVSAIAVVRFERVLIDQLRFIDFIAAALTVIAAIALPLTTLVGVLLSYSAKRAANRHRAASGGAQ